MTRTAHPLGGRRIVVTGASSGIGTAIVRAGTAAGARIVGLGRDATRLDRACVPAGGTGVVADLADPDETAAAIERAAETLGGIDCLVNNAGAMFHSKLGDGRTDDWRVMVDTNILGVLHATSAALPHLRRSSAADIVNIGSIGSQRVARSEYTVYSATKAAVRMINEGLHQELTPEGVRVTLISPGVVRETGFGDGIRDPDLQREVVAWKEAAGMAPSELADQLVAVLAAPRSVHLQEVVVSPFGGRG